LALAKDPCLSAVATLLNIDIKSVRKWRDRFLKEGRIDALIDRQRSGRPSTIDLVTRCEIIAMACGKPFDFGAITRNVWTLSSLHETFIDLHPNYKISRTSILKILNNEEIRPHRMRLWLHSPDPKFREKVTEICDLYLSPPANSIVLCIDEKTGIQALGRKFPTQMPSQGRDGRFEYEYKRNGTRKLIAALNPHTGQVYAEVRANRKAQDLV
jgi:transposase